MCISQKIRLFKNNQRGFSLIEMLVVCIILSFIGTVLYSTFYQGINLWKRSQMDRGEIRDLFFTERLTQDLRSAIPLSGQNIRGKMQEFEFFALLPGRELGLTQKMSQGLSFPCKIRYHWDQGLKKVYRDVTTYSQILTESKTAYKTSVVFENVDSFEFTFMGRNKAASVLWQRAWEKDYLPNAVKVSIGYVDQKQSFIRLITVPGGGRREPVPHYS